MRRLQYLVVFFGLISAFSCEEDFLQRDTAVPIDFNKLMSDPHLAAGFGNNSYTFLIQDFGRMNAYRGTTGMFSDEAISNDGEFGVASMNSGQYLFSTAVDVVKVYGSMYQGIRNTNVMLANIDRVPWTDEYNPAYIEGEQRFLRAFFYFELMKRFGGVVLLDKAQTVNESGADLRRSTYGETLQFILDDVDLAIALLPSDWSAANYGRATSGAAMALKARSLIHAASPLHNPDSNLEKWKAAADAAKAVMDLNKYSLEPDYANILTQPNSNEYIMIPISGPIGTTGLGFITDFICPPSFGGQRSQISVTQNHVDMYEMNNGKPITDPTSGYDPQQPYLNRDPRFYNNVIYNDQIWQGRKVETYVGGKDMVQNSAFYTKTGYYVKRLWPEVLKPGNGNTAQLNFIYFRYAEVLLNYAEALNESEGPTEEVYAALNTIRDRAGMPDLPEGLDKTQMRARIRNERAVEFAFEEMRWWDILRWRQGVELVAQPMKGMSITKTGSAFTYEVVELADNFQKVFEDHMHLYPIPREEILNSPAALEQNPGW
jgi:starch-binding outer membrane protein, SusD/RagB family